MAKSGRSHVNQSVSFPPKLLADSKVRAKTLGLSFSAFVQKCLERDLQDRPDILYREMGGEPAAAQEPKAGRGPPKPKRPRK